MRTILILISSLTLLLQSACTNLNLASSSPECLYQGSTTIYEAEQDKWYFTDEKDASVETLPASTFKIIHSLIALEENEIIDQTEKFIWDGIPRTVGTPAQVVTKWNQDTNLKMAFQNSTVWFYEVIEKRIPRGTYQRYLADNKYGNGNLTTSGNFWVYGDFAVSPIDQIEFLRKLEDGTVTFSKRTVDILKDIMCSVGDDGEKLCVKTGWTDDNNLNVGWYVGWLERASKKVFFATRLKEQVVSDVPRFLACRKQVTNYYLTKIGAELP